MLAVLFTYSDVSIAVTVTGTVRGAHTLVPQLFMIYCVSPSDFLSSLVYPPELSGKYQQRRLVAKQEKLGEGWSTNFAYEVSLSYSYGSLTCH
jgi:hypothetical protein